MDSLTSVYGSWVLSSSITRVCRLLTSRPCAFCRLESEGEDIGRVWVNYDWLGTSERNWNSVTLIGRQRARTAGKKCSVPRHLWLVADARERELGEACPKRKWRADLSAGVDGCYTALVTWEVEPCVIYDLVVREFVAEWLSWWSAGVFAARGRFCHAEARVRIRRVRFFYCVSTRMALPPTTDTLTASHTILHIDIINARRFYFREMVWWALVRLSSK